jgi:hypothetical protein
LGSCGLGFAVLLMMIWFCVCCRFVMMAGFESLVWCVVSNWRGQKLGLWDWWNWMSWSRELLICREELELILVWWWGEKGSDWWLMVMEKWGWFRIGLLWWRIGEVEKATVELREVVMSLVVVLWWCTDGRSKKREARVVCLGQIEEWLKLDGSPWGGGGETVLSVAIQNLPRIN